MRRKPPLKEFRIDVTCPECGDVQDCCNNLTGKTKPKPGDFVICIYCAALNRYDANLKLYTMPAEERAEIPADQMRKIDELHARVTVAIAQLGPLNRSHARKE